VLIVADMVMTWPTFSAGWPGFNTDEEKFRTSLDELVSREPEVVCTGHGDPIPRHAARRIACL
jgi:glyoxylase-like metal-dependent hydrolase (beta-lactamase superfamily II)